MNGIRRLRSLTAALALALAFVSVVSTAQSGSMADEMTMTAGSEAVAGGACAACPDQDGDTTMSDCLPFCHLAHPAMLAAMMRPEIRIGGAEFAERTDRPRAVSASIEPSPPKTLV